MEMRRGFKSLEHNLVGEVETKINELALISARSFSEIQQQADSRLKLVIDRFEKVEDDIHDVKIAIGPLVSLVGMADHQISDLDLRLRRVEREVGIGK